jgi:biopolymer transport protein ExbD
MNSQLAQSTFMSPMNETLRLQVSSSQKPKKSVVAQMMLTSLVDAFTIIVIYLIVNSSTAEQMDVKDGIQLPKASHSQVIDQSPLVIFKNGQFIVDDQIVSESNLTQALVTLKSKHSGFLKDGQNAIVVQADENINFEDLQPIVIASAHAGIKQVKFAVLQQEE